MQHRTSPERTASTEREPDDLLRLTGDRGEKFPEIDPEPEPGSIVLTEGAFGTAWQRHYETGLWHAAGRVKGKPWAYLTERRNLFLAYDAPRREG